MKKLIFLSLINLLTLASPNQLDVLELLMGKTDDVASRIVSYKSFDNKIVFSADEFKELIIKNPKINALNKQAANQYFYVKEGRGLDAMAYMGNDIELDLLGLSCFIPGAKRVYYNMLTFSKLRKFDINSHLVNRTNCIEGTLYNSNFSMLKGILPAYIGGFKEYKLDDISNLFKTQKKLNIASAYACSNIDSGASYKLCSHFVKRGGIPFIIEDDFLALNEKILFMLDDRIIQSLVANHGDELFNKRFLVHKDISQEIRSNLILLMFQISDFYSIRSIVNNVHIDFNQLYSTETEFLSEKIVKVENVIPTALLVNNSNLSQEQVKEIATLLNEKMAASGFQFHQKLFDELESEKPDYAWIKLFMKNQDMNKVAFDQVVMPFPVYLKWKGFESIDELLGNVDDSTDTFDDLMDF
ncbi:MAG: hypothetical protein BM556_11765 [Bacteriovorax sp. MedPE-SWde]|nr:MAG: hypothetical protein BM556_11765 [Bacteriovorax sp. MedPE-SWde]